MKPISEFPKVKPAGSGRRKNEPQAAPGYVPGHFSRTMRLGFPPSYEPLTLHLCRLGPVRPAHEGRETQLAKGHASATGRVLGLPGTPDQVMPEWQKKALDKLR